MKARAKTEIESLKIDSVSFDLFKAPSCRFFRRRRHDGHSEAKSADLEEGNLRKLRLQVDPKLPTLIRADPSPFIQSMQPVFL